MENQGLHGVNDARAIRIGEIMTDLREMLYYLAALRAPLATEDYYLEGYSLLRHCISESQAIVGTPFSAGDAEDEGVQLQS